MQRNKKLIFIFFVLFFLLWSNSFLKQHEKLQSEQKYVPQTFVLLSSSVKLRYRFLLPIAVKFWQILDVKVIVVLINDPDTKESDLHETLKLLKELNATTKIFSPKKLSSASFSQLIRLFGAVLPSINEMFSNDSILITSDADLAVFNLSNHVPNIFQGKTIRIHNIACCEPIEVPPMRGNFKVPQYAISTIGATVKTWKEIMDLKKIAYSIDEIEDYVIEEFGEKFFNPSDENLPNFIGSTSWYADQSLFAYKMSKWLNNSTFSQLSHENRDFSRRIDRSRWPISEQFATMKIEDFDDCHQPTATYAEGEWEMYKPFLEWAFKNQKKLLNRFTEYRNNVIL